MSDLPTDHIRVSVAPVGKFEEYLRTQGMRLTQERSIIVEEVFSTHEHFDADQLTDRLASRTDGRRVSRATVYRNLTLMEEAGLLRKVARTNDRDVWEHDYGYPQHDHLICETCGKMIEFPNEAFRELLAEISDKHGFLLDRHRLEAFGICAECAGPKKRHKKLDLL